MKSNINWEKILPWIGTLLTLVTILIGVNQYKNSQRNALYLEFMRMDAQKQMDVYTHICNAVGNIAAAAEYRPEEYKIRYDAFMQLYWGESILVADPVVDSTMRQLRTWLEPGKRVDPNKVELIKIKTKGFADSCRNSIGRLREKWEKELRN